MGAWGVAILSDDIAEDVKETYTNGNQKLNKIAIFTSGKRDDPTKRIKLVAEGVRIILPLILVKMKQGKA